MIKKLYPYGKKKAFNVTYDDGVLQDVRFVELLNKYNLKGTFNLNSGLMEREFEWTHESGLVVKRLKKDVVVGLYKGHEVASHTLNHPYMENLTKEEIINELSQDKANLEQIFSREIKGFALPFHYYNDLIKQEFLKRQVRLNCQMTILVGKRHFFIILISLIVLLKSF